MPNPRVFLDISIGGVPAGRLVVELYKKDAPKTVANFTALCTGEHGRGESGHKLWYKKCPFHRIIPGFMAQGGDITKRNGTGGESIYGRRFDDEPFVHTHHSPGMLSMANAGPNTNSSQFFLTFKAQPHLDGKHVVFGQVVEGIEVLKQMEETTTGPNDKPLAPVVIAKCGELVLRSDKKKKQKEGDEEDDESDSGRHRKKHKKHRKKHRHDDESDSDGSGSDADRKRTKKRRKRDKDDSGSEKEEEPAREPTPPPMVRTGASGRKIRGRGQIKYGTPPRETDHHGYGYSRHRR